MAYTKIIYIVKGLPSVLLNCLFPVFNHFKLEIVNTTYSFKGQATCLFFEDRDIVHELFNPSQTIFLFCVSFYSVGNHICIALAAQGLTCILLEILS